MSPSLNTTQPENIAHGSELVLQAMGPAGGWVPIAEIFEMDYEEDQMMEDLPVLGSRRTGRRRGRLNIQGTIKVYWLNSFARSMWAGVPTPVAGGAPSQATYHSATPYQRYQIQMISNVNGQPVPALTFVNVTFGKDTVRWNADRLTTEDITFDAEDIQGQ